MCDLNAKLYDVFNGDFRMIGIAESIFNRMDYENSDDGTNVWDCLIDAINNELIYTADQWVVLEYYCNPTDANWEIAMEQFLEDLEEILFCLID